jgi:hypothetical protein
MSDPIIVNATPTADQIAAALRQGIAAVGAIAGTLGVTGIFSDAHLNQATALVGPIATVLAIVWGQLETRSKAKKLTITAAAAPNSVAQVK